MKLKHKEQGAAVLIMTVILLVAALLLMLYAAQYNNLMQKTTSNQYTYNQAFQAADAGMDYALAYLQTNGATVTASASSGNINYSLTGNLTNGSSYTVTYTNPTANNYKVLQITAIGRSADGTSTQTIAQQVYQVPPALYTVTTKGNISVNGSGGNVTGNAAIQAGGSVDSSASAGGTVTPNDATINGMSNNNFFSYFFNRSPVAMQAISTVYANSGSVPWSTLSGYVWVNDDVFISGPIVVGTTSNPVLLVVNGTYTTSGQVTINGVLYVTGDADIRGNAGVTGAIISEGNILFRGNSVADYNAAIIQTIIGNLNPGFSGYNRITGSWKDF